MDEYKIYSITDEYINYLRVAEPNVYSNKQDNDRGSDPFTYKELT